MNTVKIPKLMLIFNVMLPHNIILGVIVNCSMSCLVFQVYSFITSELFLWFVGYFIQGHSFVSVLWNENVIVTYGFSRTWIKVVVYILTLSSIYIILKNSVLTSENATRHHYKDQSLNSV
jgi:hypothetical protein